ncbi:MAG: 2,5-diketo-D-gluconate reductase [Variibacter sp.]|jgi:diketogulonate reductase-like aldo/keto reductase|nr:2,5-diketo-D-gluconate reductase [Variibacter sp.]
MQIVEANGARIPSIGLGTWELRGDTCTKLVSEALRVGYRHIDTAAMYGNEAEVGEGIRASAVKRDDIFLTTKVWLDDLREADFRRSVERSLKNLKLPYVDLILIHWPNPAIPLGETLRAMAKVKRDGLARHIGVSNFTVGLIEEAVTLSEEPLVTNQIEMHPFLDQSKVLAACRKRGLSVTAYCPIARGNVAGNAVLATIAKAHGKSAAQVSLRYLVQQGIIAIPRTSKPARLVENLSVFDFALTDAEMRQIAGLTDPGGRVVNFGAAPAWD